MKRFKDGRDSNHKPSGKAGQSPSFRQKLKQLHTPHKLIFLWGVCSHPHLSACSLRAFLLSHKVLSWAKKTLFTKKSNRIHGLGAFGKFTMYLKPEPEAPGAFSSAASKSSVPSSWWLSTPQVERTAAWRSFAKSLALLQKNLLKSLNFARLVEISNVFSHLPAKGFFPT